MQETRLLQETTVSIVERLISDKCYTVEELVKKSHRNRCQVTAAIYWLTSTKAIKQVKNFYIPTPETDVRHRKIKELPENIKRNRRAGYKRKHIQDVWSADNAQRLSGDIW